MKIFWLLLILISCSNGRLINSSPARNELMTGSPPGPENFKKGWRDGCDTGIGNSHNNFYKTFYVFKKDYILNKTDSDYNIGWNRAYWFCSRYHERYNMLGEEKYGGAL